MGISRLPWARTAVRPSTNAAISATGKCPPRRARAGAALLPDTLTGRSLDEIVRVLRSQGGEAATLPLGC
jgi:hypothetical protein